MRALRLADMVSFVLESGTADDNEWWVGALGAPDPDHTYVAYLDRALRAERARGRHTIIRVYTVK